MIDSKEKEKWSDVLKILEREVTAVSFDLWIKKLEILDIVDNTIILAAVSETAKNQCLKNHKESITIAIKEVYSEVESFKILSSDEKKDFLDSFKEADGSLNQKNLFNFNKKYTFDSFIVGNSNRVVANACKAVAKNPGSKYNPLFIYGGVGLGKTHLLHSIGNYLSGSNPDLKVLYATCEDFTNDYIETLSNNRKDISSFREKYRSLDVLMIDDIQFISNKTETQEQFFHTFNSLYENDKQVIIASDRHPRDIKTLNDRMKSRFGMGLIQDIQTPEFETRVSILRKKAQLERYNVLDNVFDFLAEKSSSLSLNVRVMEGLLKNTYYLSALSGKDKADINDAKETLKSQLESEPQNLTPEIILDKVCRYYNIAKDAIIGKSKKKEIVHPRQVSIYLINNLLTLPLVSIGKIFGGRDHTTIMHSRDKISEGLKNNQTLKVEVSDIKDMIYRK